VKFRFYLYVFFLIPCFAIGQEMNVDDIIKEAQLQVEKGNYENALGLIEPVLQKYPDNQDVRIYKGRIYSWKKDYESAIAVLAPMADKEPPNTEAVLALINTYYWSGNYEAALKYADKYLITYPTNNEVRVIKANALEKLERDTEALAVLEKISITDNSNQAVTGLRMLIGRKAKNAIAASYLNVSTHDPGQAPFHYGYVEYSRKFSKSSVVGRANIGHAFDETEALFEADYYQTFSRRNYLYLNAGVSTGETVFPVTRAGAEYYFVPHRKFDYSLGIRFMDFAAEDVTLVTGQAAWHPGAYTLSYRPLYDVASELFSHVISIQKSNEDKERLVKLELQYGNVPYLYLYTGSIEPLKAYRAGLQYQHRIGSSTFVRPVFLYEYEEYIPEQFRHKINLQLIVTKRF